MSQFPTEEEEFELMYNDEMEMIDEMNDEEMVNLQQSHSQNPSTKILTNQTAKSILQSPQLSQISFDGTSAGPSGIGGLVNRRLFGTPGGPLKRISSTPFQKTTSEPRFQLPCSSSSILNDIVEEPFPNALTEIQNIGINRKRRLEDLFGDIHDIEQEDYVDKEAKKMKNEEERDLELIEKILEARKKTRETKNPLKKDNLDILNALHAFKIRNLANSIPIWPCIPLVRSDSERIYVRMHSELYETQHIDEINVFSKGYKGLLGESKDDIWNGAREISLKRLTAPQSDPDIVIIESAPSKKDEILWVEKYRPKKYIHLLSDETTNRSLLYWLKMWDKIVFGKEFRPNDAKIGQLNTFNKKTGRFESTGGWNRRVKQQLNMDRDEHGRPIQKIALLCGPPGLGKTTLAHTIAKHAGYNIREINASDDRSPDAFKLALENGTQMTSVLNENRRPNCIILDEIDGAPIPSIDFLIKFITDNYIAKSNKKPGSTRNKNVLKRPIICICNDMYTPSLRLLRQIAFVVNFPPIESSRLAERLLEIADKENMKADLGTMLALAEKSGNDVRSCISMMEFFNANKKKLTLHDVLSNNFGQKDRHRGLFEVWSAIFQIQRPRRQLANENPHVISENNTQQLITMTDTTPSSRAKYILEVVHMGGDYERLMQGVYENYLNQKMPDPNLNGIVEATNWFCFSDSVQKQINNLQNYSVYPYLQYGFIIWHLLFASLSWPKIHFPTKGFEVHQKTTIQKMIFQSLRKGISGSSLGIGQGKIILIDTVPLLKKILSPQLRSVSLQLLTTKERYDLTNTVAIMADLGLAFTQIKQTDGTYQYTMEPDIDLLCKFQGFQGISLSYFGRQLIAREVELEQMRRIAPKITEKTVKQNSKNKEIINTIGKKSKEQEKSSPTNNLPNHLQNLKPKIRQNNNFKETVSKDFFGRLSKKQIPLTTKEGGTDSIVKSPIWYRYKQGFNNAVRKDIIMSELL